MNKRALGSEKEQLAADYLIKQGMRITEYNFRNRYGEIDLVGEDGDYLVFVEVKFRTDAKNGSPFAAVDRRKQATICRTADYYRVTHHISWDRPIRYDVVGILGNKISWIPNAFSHIGF